jgi:hypothetical protein
MHCATAEHGLRFVPTCTHSRSFDTRIQRLELYYIINYFIKYVELLDTVFLALKKKPLGLS